MRGALLPVILFLSGASALLFQTLWLRLSGLAFGNSVWSAGLILSSFMAGLALGNAIAASPRLRPARPLRCYALLEIVVALFGCTIVFALPLVGDGLRPFFQLWWKHDAALNALRWLVSFLILLVPTSAMGLTLPVLLGDAVLRRYDFGRATGLLYGANTLGAVLGVLLGESWLFAAVGLWGTGLVAAGVSLSAAALAWFTSTTEPKALDVAPAGEPAARAPWRILGVSAGAGGLMLCLEVVWFRFLHLYVASSATAFAVMLAAVLAGIGLGGLVFGVRRNRPAASAALPPVLLLAAASAVLLCYIFFPVPSRPAGAGWFYVEAPAQVAWLSLALMFPVAFLSGLLFPAIVAQVGERPASRTNSAGLVTLCNTIGAAAGAILASFVLLPALGFQRALLACAAGYALLAPLATRRAAWSPRRPEGKLLIALAVLAVGLFVFFPYRRDEAHLANARHPYEADGARLVRTVEGTSDTWQLLQADVHGRPYFQRLVTNGYSMSGTLPRSQRYMRLFAQLPLAFQPAAKDALLICYGVGVTADAFVREPRLAHLDVVDVSREVFALADAIDPGSGSGPLRDPRVTTFVQDGRFFLQACPGRYDIITGEPPPLKVAGAVNLYTEDFFSLMRGRLNDGGIATFWLPIYQLKVDEVKAILRGFHNAFPNASVWSGPDQEWIMVGMNGPGRPLTEPELRGRWADPAVAVDLVRHGVEVPEQLGAMFVMDAAEIERITRDVAPLTDRFPKRLSDAAPDPEAIHRFAWTYMEGAPAWRRFRSSALIQRIWPASLQVASEPFFVLREVRYLSGITNSNWLAALDLYLRGSRLRTPVLEVFNTDEVRVAIAEQQSRPPVTARPELTPDLVAGALARRDYPAAIKLLENARSRGFGNPNDFFLLAYLYCLTNAVPKAEALAAGAPPVDDFSAWLWEKLRADFGFRPPR